MLQQLNIKNYALIEELSVDFTEGFSVITGETGAGKSILLGALGFVLGDRADTGVLFNKEMKCVVEAHFQLNNDALKPLFDHNDLDFYLSGDFSEYAFASFLRLVFVSYDFNGIFAAFPFSKKKMMYPL